MHQTTSNTEILLKKFQTKFPVYYFVWLLEHGQLQNSPRALLKLAASSKHKCTVYSDLLQCSSRLLFFTGMQLQMSRQCHWGQSADSCQEAKAETIIYLRTHSFGRLELQAMRQKNRLVSVKEKKTVPKLFYYFYIFRVNKLHLHLFAICFWRVNLWFWF